jgi:hypothetical protein
MKGLNTNEDLMVEYVDLNTLGMLNDETNKENIF